MTFKAYREHYARQRRIRLGRLATPFLIGLALGAVIKLLHHLTWLLQLPH